MKYRLLIFLFVAVLVLCELVPTYISMPLVLAQNPLTDAFVGPWWCCQRSHPYSSPSQIVADVVTLKNMNFNGVVIIDDDLRQYLWGITSDNDPSQYRSALIAQECQKNGMDFTFMISYTSTDPDSPTFRNSFGPRLQVIANYFKQFSNFHGLQFDDWAAVGNAAKVHDYAEWDSWLRSQFNIGRLYWIAYDDSWLERSIGWPLADKINQPYTITGCYYSQTFDPSWIDTFATGYPWTNYRNHKLGLIVSSFRYSDAPGQWSPDTIRPWIEAALKYPLFKSFEYFGWRLSSPNQDTEWANDLAAHPEWWSVIASINAEIILTGTLRVFTTIQSGGVVQYVATSVVANGPQVVTGMTTADPANPLCFTSLTPGTYDVSGTYLTFSDSKLATVVAGNIVDVTLSFPSESSPPKVLLQLFFIGVSSAGVVGLVLYGMRKQKHTYFSFKKLRKSKKKKLRKSKR
jgi:hypothetical protein